MVKSKKETNKPKTKEEPPFDLHEALKKVHPLMKEGFHHFILGLQITNQADFDKYYKIYKGDE